MSSARTTNPEAAKPTVPQDSVEQSSSDNLSRSAFTALKWNYLGVIARTVSSLAIGIVLAHLLGPVPFGQVAVAWFVIGLGTLLANFGFGSALIQSEKLSEEDVRFVFTVQMGLGIALSLALALSAHWVSWLFRQPEVALVIAVMGLFFVLQAFGQTAASLLRRRLAFKELQMAQVSSYLVGYIVFGIPLAYLGLGVWSLVIAQLSQVLIYSAYSYAKAQHSLVPLLRWRRDSLMRFGIKVICTNVLNWVIVSLDRVFISRSFGTANLGLYDRSQTLMSTPVMTLLSALQTVLFSTYSRAQDREAGLRRVYLASITVVAFLLLPTCLAIAFVPHTVIEGLYGQRWSAAAPLLVPIALAMPLHAMMGLAGPPLWGLGKVERELRVEGVVVIWTVLTVLVTSRISIYAIAWGFLGICFVRFVLLTVAVAKPLRVSAQDIIGALRGVALLAVCTVVAVRVADTLLLGFGVQTVIRLAADSVTGLSTLLVCLLGIPAIFNNARLFWTDDVLWLMGKLHIALPKFVRVPAPVASEELL